MLEAKVMGRAKFRRLLGLQGIDLNPKSKTLKP